MDPLTKIRGRIINPTTLIKCLIWSLDQITESHRTVGTQAEWHHITDTWAGLRRTEIIAIRGKPCTLHSWSDMGKGRGEWQAVCYTADHRYGTGMWNKPLEITGYPAAGYENVYHASDLLIPAVVVRKWENDPATGDIMHEKGIWRDSNWKTMGIGVHGTYASLWLGNYNDSRGALTGCSQ